MKNIRLQAHRGVSSEYPENTIAAFEAAVQEGYSIIELDPKFTADDRCVILHDRSLNRTGRNADGTPIAQADLKISDISLKEARSYDMGLWMGEAFRGEKIPTLEETIDFIKTHHLPFKFDNVWEKFPAHQQEILLSTLEKADLGQKLGFTCKTLPCLKQVARRFPEAELHWDGANDEETLKQVQEIAGSHRLTLWVCYDNPISSWFQGTKATREVCDRVRSYGEVGIWILTNEEELRISVMEFGADTIETTGHVKPGMLKGR